MLLIGAHLSSAKGYVAMAKDAASIDATTCAFFTRNPRGGKAKAFDGQDVGKFLTLTEEQPLAPMVAHAPYTMNACAKDPGLRAFAQEMMVEDLARLRHMPGHYYNFHPGSHVGQGVALGIGYIVELLNGVLAADEPTTILLETMAGKGSEVGSHFEELASIRSELVHPEHVGICLDTCHLWDGGYDIVGDLDGVLTEFDNIIGLDHLYAIHLNDSLNPKGSHKDRHAKIGAGEIGLDAIIRIINHPALRHLPFVLETPNELDGYAAEIALLRDAYRA